MSFNDPSWAQNLYCAPLVKQGPLYRLASEEPSSYHGDPSALLPSRQKRVFDPSQAGRTTLKWTGMHTSAIQKRIWLVLTLLLPGEHCQIEHRPVWQDLEFISTRRVQDCAQDDTQRTPVGCFCASSGSRTVI